MSAKSRAQGPSVCLAVRGEGAARNRTSFTATTLRQVLFTPHAAPLITLKASALRHRATPFCNSFAA